MRGLWFIISFERAKEEFQLVKSTGRNSLFTEHSVSKIKKNS